MTPRKRKATASLRKKVVAALSTSHSEWSLVAGLCGCGDEDLRRIVDWRDLPPDARGASVALGNFDGLHRGHQAVLDAARDAASERGAPLAVAVFSPHPRRFFQPHTAPFRLMSDDVRDRLLPELGAELLYVLPFDRDMSLLDDRAFAREVLLDGLGVAHVSVGFDYRFGRDRVGDTESLKQFGADSGFGVTIVSKVGEEAVKYSSSAIRKALSDGDLATAERALTRPWTIDGLVERGDQRGRVLGFPTANVSLGPLIRPRFGVYAVEARIEGEALFRPGVANIGRRPTFGGEDERLEAHLFDFAGDLYGRRLEVRVRTFLRPEQAFNGLDALKEQIALDAQAARDALAAQT